MIKWWKGLSIQERRLAIIAFSLCLLYFVLEHINGRNDFWDFRVYFGAAQDLVQKTSPYESYYGLMSGYYKYSPIVLILFIPFTLLPYWLASGIFYFLITCGIIYLVLEIHRLLKNKIHLELKIQYLPVYLILFLMIAHLARELHLGNVNLLLLLVFFVAFRNIESNNKWKAGAWIAFGILVKPHFIILLPLFVLKTEWKILTSIGVSLVVLLLLPTLYLGWDENQILITSWFDTMAKHNESLLNSPNTIYGMLSSFFAFFSITLSEKLIVFVLSIAALGIFLLVMRNKLFKSIDAFPVGNYLEYFILIALIPNLTHTDTEHFLWTLPILFLGLYLICSIQKTRNRALWLGWILLISIPWYVNSPDLIGQAGAEMMDKGGWIGLSNFLIILTTVYFFFQKKKWI